VFTIPLPPLRRRGADVIALARRMARSVAQQYQLPSPNFDERFQEMLLAYPWPGNVRELRNVIEKAVILADQGPLSAEDLPTPDPNLSRPEAAEMGDGTGFVVPAAFDEEYTFAESKSQMIERWEVVYIEDLLSRTGGNIAWAARMARLDKKNLHRKLKRYGIDARAHKRTA
jgi:DNA-binding NtrC family response regulator